MNNKEFFGQDEEIEDIIFQSTKKETIIEELQELKRNYYNQKQKLKNENFYKSLFLYLWFFPSGISYIKYNNLFIVINRTANSRMKFIEQ
jgi:hypothetical protein